MIGGRIALVDDHTLVRQALAQALTDCPDIDIDVVLQSDDVDAVLTLEPAPDLVLLDLFLGDHEASASDVRALMDRGSKVLVVSALGSPATVRAMLDAGVAGFLSKRESTDTLIAAVTAVLVGGTWTTPELASILASDNGPDRPELSPQERRVLTLYASGLTLTSVAHQLGIKPGTVREYLERIRAKYDATGRTVRTKTELYQQALRDGILEPPR
jgi:DNA-binding NarL/FixJ family response regulator